MFASQPIDLTLPLRHGMRGVAFSPKHRLAVDGWNSTILELYSHAGTHLDAPVHFGAGEGTIDQIAPHRFLSIAWLADVSRVGPGGRIGLPEVGAVADQVRPGQSLLLRTGWSQYVDSPALYRDRLPRIGEDLAHWCVERGINAIGVEPPSVADVNNLPEVTRIHCLLLGAGIMIVEGLAQLEALPPSPFLFGAFPLKLEGIDGSPCRALAWPLP